MERLSTPSLPKGQVKIAVCGGTERIRDELSEYIPELIVPAPELRLPEATRTHADMVCCHAGEGRFFAYDRELAYSLERLGCVCTIPDIAPGMDYPHDAALNCARIGNTLVYGKRSAAAEIVRYAAAEGIPTAAVAQGYVRCSCAIVDERSVITADTGIAAALRKAGVDVLLISPGYVELPGYSYGFIGGACGKLNADVMYFSGELDNHPDAERMLEFLSERGITAVFGKGALFDFGGFIPIFE